MIPRTHGPPNVFYSAQRLDLCAWCVRLSRLLVCFRTHLNQCTFIFISFHSFIQARTSTTTFHKNGLPYTHVGHPIPVGHYAPHVKRIAQLICKLTWLWPTGWPIELTVHASSLVWFAIAYVHGFLLNPPLQDCKSVVTSKYTPLLLSVNLNPAELLQKKLKSLFSDKGERANWRESTWYFPAGVSAAFVIGYSHVNDVTSKGWFFSC